MGDAWAARFVDTQMDQAWLDLRLRLADRVAAGIADGDMDPIDISTATGETLTVNVDDEHVVIIAGDDVYTTENVDKAAYAVFRVLHDDWRVIHPAFLDSEIVDVPAIDDYPAKVVVPVFGKADSTEQLQEWVVATFSEDRSEPLKMGPEGEIWWRTPRGNSVVVKVRNEGRIEIRAVLARQVGFRKAHQEIDRLSRQYFGLKFFLIQDNLVMSQIVIAHPFCGEQLSDALRTFIVNTDELGWVAEKVLRKRVKAERDQLADAKQALADAEARLGDAEVAADTAQDQVAHLKHDIARIRQERDVARTALNRMKRFLERGLGHQTFHAPPERGEAA